MRCYSGTVNVPTTKCKTRIFFFSILQILLGGMNNSLAQSTYPKTTECKLVAEQNCNVETQWPVCLYVCVCGLEIVE